MSKKQVKSVSSNKKLITKQEMVLLKNSEEAKNTDIYGNLYDCLETYTDLSKTKMDKDPVFDNKARVTLTNNKKLLMKNIQDEWYSKSSYLIATNDTFCQLCGRKNIFVCYIVNRINGNELNVGKDCVTNFKTINGLDTVITELNKAQRDYRKDARKIEFEVREGDEVDFLKQAESMLSDFPILLPYGLNCDLKNTLADCNRTKTIYIKSGGDIDETFITFNTLKEKFKKLYKTAWLHYQKVKDQPLICDRRLAAWIFEKFPHVQEMIQKNNGIFNEETLKFIYEPEFVKSKISTFKSHFDSTDVKIIGVEGDVIRFFIKNNMYFQPITFTVPTRDFMRHVGCYCLTNEYYIYVNKNLPNIKIENTSANFDSVYNSISDILKANGYDFIIDNKTSQAYWEKYQFRTGTSKWRKNTIPEKPIYKKTTIEQLLNMISSFLFDGDSLRKSPHLFTRRIDVSGMWITKAEKDQNARIAAEAAGQRKRREFIPY